MFTKKCRVVMENIKVSDLRKREGFRGIIELGYSTILFLEHQLTDDTIGTWVPLERAKEIAALYNVGELLKPIFEFRPSTESPPLAPKHVTAASTKPRPARAPARAAPAAAPVKRVTSKFELSLPSV